MNVSINRRDFINAGAAGLTATLTGGLSLAEAETRKVRLGFVGLGGQGTGLLRMCLDMDDVEVPALSEIKPDRLQRAVDLVVKSGRKEPEGYSGEEDFRKLCERSDLDGVIVATPWLWHTPMCVTAMKARKYVAPEVWGASSLEECWELVKASEESGMPCMMLENHCYERTPMAVLKMVRAGIFGELVHGECGYCHDLRALKFEPPDARYGPGARGEGEWRTEHSIKRNGDLYPTHGLGPIANCMDINRGNRMVTLTSTPTDSNSLHEFIVRQVGPDHPSAKLEIKLADIVTTVVKCQNGETIIIKHDTNLPRPYTSNYLVQGTKAVWMEHRDLVSSIYIDEVSPAHKWETIDKYLEEWEHPMWQKFLKGGVKGGHGGADWLKARSFVECVKRRIPTPIDVYDTAAWISVSPLSEESITKGSAPVDFPDFTGGMWMKRKPIFGLSADY